MNVAIIQPICWGDLRKEETLQKHLKILRDSIRENKGYDIYFFPELFLGRYTNDRMDELKEMAGRFKCYIVTGGVYFEKEKKDLYNSAFIVSQKSVRRHDKVHLWIGEEKWFSKGSSFQTYKIKDVLFSLFVCSDIVDPRFVEKEGVYYNKKALDTIFRKKNPVIGILSFTFKNGLEKWDKSLREVSKKYATTVIFCNYKNVVKGEDGFEYGGNNSAVYFDGKKIKGVDRVGKYYDVLFIELPLHQI